VNWLSNGEKKPTVIKHIMTERERKTLLEKLSTEKQLAFVDVIPNGPLLTDIVSQLNSLDKVDKDYFLEFATTLKAELFEKGVTIKGLNLESYGKITSHSKEEAAKEGQASRYNEIQTEFQELLKKLALTLAEHFEILKGYFITKLENNPLDSYKLMVLHDNTFFIQPIKKKLLTTFPDVIFKRIEELSHEIGMGIPQQGNLLCLLLLMPRSNDEPGIANIKDNLTLIIESYTSFESYSLKSKIDTKSRNYESSISKEDFFEEIEFVNSTLLSNGSIKHEEEKIIKKLFRSFQTPLLVYKTVKLGNSGAKVIEIRPKKELGNEYEKRYIIKYSEKNPERKIDTERKCFGKWIAGYKGFKDYECEYVKTLTHEGLRYSYAISDTESESFSFNDILSEKSNSFHSDKINIIDELFSIEIYKTWRDSLEPIECTTSQLYEPYVSIDKTFEEIEKILNLSKTQVETGDLFLNFYKIWNKKFRFQQKICHGDLHSENFLKDKNGIYLIDFGYTGIRHALIDHTSLECSIKFKHVPFYVQIEELNNIENELLLDTSFQLSTRFTNTLRPDMLEMLEIIKRIRNNSVPLFVESNSITEYLLSLFIMSFREIRYKDLNQLYAYNSALILSKRLIQLLDL
jgi:hypothetical protein